MSEEESETITSITTEKRKTNFKVRFIPEVEISPDAWVKLNNAEPIISKTLNMFQLQDQETNEMVNLQLSLHHTETITTEIRTSSVKGDGNDNDINAQKEEEKWIVFRYKVEQGTFSKLEDAESFCKKRWGDDWNGHLSGEAECIIQKQESTNTNAQEEEEK